MVMLDNQKEDEGSRVVVRATRTVIYLQERAERKQGRRYRPKKKNIQAAKFRKEQKKQWKQNRKEEKELKKRRKEFEQEKNSLEKDSEEKKSTEHRAGAGKSGEGTSRPKQNQEKPDSRQKPDAKRQEAYEEYIRNKKEKKNRQKQEETSGRKQAETGPAGASRETEELLCKKKKELEKKEAELKKQEEAFKKRKKEEKTGRKQSRRKKRHSRAARHLKGKLGGIIREDAAVLKSSMKPAKKLLMIADDLDAEKLAKQAATTGVRMIVRLFRHMSLFVLTAAKSVLLLLSPLLLLSVFLVFMIYIIFFSPLSSVFQGYSGYEDGEAFPYLTMWEHADDTEIKAAVQAALIERQTELTTELKNTYENVRLISFAPSEEEIKDFTVIMIAMMKADGVYPDDISSWLSAKAGKSKCKELAELVCYVLTDEEVAALYPEVSKEPVTGEEETTGDEEKETKEETKTQPQYLDKYLGFYRLEELRKMGKLKEYEFFLD